MQVEINKLWSEIKQKEKDFNEELKKLQIMATKKKSSLLNFWATRPTAAPKPDDEEVQVLTPAAAASSAEESSSTSSNSACRGQEIIKKIKSTIARIVVYNVYQVLSKARSPISLWSNRPSDSLHRRGKRWASSVNSRKSSKRSLIELFRIRNLNKS